MARSVFCHLSEDLLAKLDQGRSVRRYQAGEVLFYEGEAPLAMYCLHDGVVKLVKAARDGRTMVIRLLGGGDIAGFRALLTDEPYAATAEVAEPATVCTVPAATFKGLLQESVQFSLDLLHKVAVELRVSEERMLDQAILPARTRVARILLFLADTSSPSSQRLVVATELRHQDLADAVGITPQTFSRIIHELNGSGILRTNRQHIEIVDPGRLRDLAARDT
ncbi:MAG: Crp/Fnr family transcriptional regulator [Candidatus Zixiibacteriota bacterium]